MPLTQLDICSRALAKIGASPIASFDEGTSESLAARLLFESTRDALLSSYPWSFATAQGTLQRLSLKPLADYQYAFQLPGDFLCALSAGVGDKSRGLRYRIHQDQLHCNASQVILNYIYRPHESSFPPFFSQALIARMAAELCLPITESLSRSDSLFRRAAQDLKTARQIDARQDMPAALNDFPLIEVRH